MLTNNTAKHDIVVILQPYMLDNFYAFVSEVRRHLRLANIPYEDIKAFECDAQRPGAKLLDVAQKYVNVKVESPDYVSDSE